MWDTIKRVLLWYSYIITILLTQAGILFKGDFESE